MFLSHDDDDNGLHNYQLITDNSLSTHHNHHTTYYSSGSILRFHLITHATYYVFITLIYHNHIVGHYIMSLLHDSSKISSSDNYPKILARA